MATTTNYGWTTPNDTDLVKDGAAAIRTLGSSVDTTTKNLNPETTLGDISFRSATSNVNTRLGIGSSGQVLTVAAGVPSWATSDDANAIQNTIVDAKGDIVAASANDTPARLAVGTDNHRLVAASGEATGLKYVADTQNTVIDAAGDLVYGTAADTLGRLAIGTAGQVLKVNSGATAPEWGTAASAGGWTELASGSIAASATGFDLTSISSSYYELKLFLNDVNTSSSAGYQVYLRFNNDSGNVYSGYYTGQDTTSFFSGKYNLVTYAAIGTNEDAVGGHNYVITIPNYTNASGPKFLRATQNQKQGNIVQDLTIGWFAATPAAIDRITLLTDTQTFDGGTYKLYGVK